jgi:hypothetical protein
LYTVGIIVLALITIPSYALAQSSGDTIQIKDTLKAGDYVSTNLYFQNATINFGKGNDICPDNNCIMQFQDTTFNEFGQDRIISGTLKVEDKANSTADFKSFVYYKLSGSFHLTRSMENPKTGESTLFYEGDLGIDRNEAIFNPQFKYESAVKLSGNNFELNGHA